jgi:ferredoxin
MSKLAGRKVKLYRNKCIGCGFCISLLPEVWTYSKFDGRITSVATPSYDDDEQIVQIEPFYRSEIDQSVNICPVNAIKKV